MELETESSQDPNTYDEEIVHSDLDALSDDNSSPQVSQAGMVEDDSSTNIDIRDPGQWPQRITDSERCFIVSGLADSDTKGWMPDLTNSLRDGRKLTKDWFTKTLPGGLKVHRSWLLYSQSKNALFCVPCKLFTQSESLQNVSVLAKEEGFTQ